MMHQDQIVGIDVPNLIMMVGPSGAGKSRIAKSLGLPVVSTDVIRKNLFGLDAYNFKINTKAYTPKGFEDTFTAAANIVKAYILAGQSVVYDATNLSVRDRSSFLNNIGVYNLANISYYVVNRPLEDKLADYYMNVHLNGTVEHTNENIIRSQHQKFLDNIKDLLAGKDILEKIEIRNFFDENQPMVIYVSNN